MYLYAYRIHFDLGFFARVFLLRVCVSRLESLYSGGQNCPLEHRQTLLCD